MYQNARQLPGQSIDGTVLDLGTSFDANGNVAGVTDYTAAARQTKSMGYDGLDRLTSTTSPMFGSATYAYDTLDNLKQVTVSGGSAPRNHYYCYHATSRRLDFVRSGPVCTGTASPAVTTLGYDVQGNLGNKNGTTYTFDYGNRLRSTAGLTYRYDAQGRRVRQDTANSQLKYSFYSGDGKLRWQRDEPAAKRLSHLYLAGSLVAELSRPIGAGTAAYTYQHTDALGSPIAKTNSAGTVIETSEYEPYGKLLNRANDDRPGYTGHVMDSASGLTYMQQRYYDPQIGRFLSVDPVTANSVTGSNFNRYWYANNNPYKFTDPDGRYSCSGAMVCSAVRNGLKGMNRSLQKLEKTDSKKAEIVRAAIAEIGTKGDGQGPSYIAGEVKGEGIAHTDQMGTTKLDMVQIKDIGHNELAKAMGHEATHDIDVKTGGIKSTESQIRETETNAYGATQAVAQGLGETITDEQKAKAIDDSVERAMGRSRQQQDQ